MHGFSGFLCEVHLIRQHLLEVHNILIKKHTSDLTSDVLSEGSLNLRIDGVTDELLLFVGVLNSLQLSQVNLRKWHERDLHLLRSAHGRVETLRYHSIGWHLLLIDWRKLTETRLHGWSLSVLLTGTTSVTSSGHTASASSLTASILVATSLVLTLRHHTGLSWHSKAWLAGHTSTGWIGVGSSQVKHGAQELIY